MLGVTVFDCFSLCSMKHDAIVGQGIPIHERIPIPEELIPADSRVEIDAKIHAGSVTCFCFSARVTSIAVLTKVPM